MSRQHIVKTEGRSGSKSVRERREIRWQNVKGSRVVSVAV
jgi:hypothetical protein